MKRKTEVAMTVEKAHGSASRFTGTTVLHSRVPSGIPLRLEEDQEGVFAFLGQKDITDKISPKNLKVDAKGELERVYYLVFYDGRRVVSMPVGYALSEVAWERDSFYYITNQGAIPMAGRNPMNDYDVHLLGCEGDITIMDGNDFVLTIANIRALNYEKLNYPLRKV